MAAAVDARATAQSRSHVVAMGLLQAAQVVALVAVLLCALAEFPWAAAAAPSIPRFAACFLVPQRICFLIANGLVIGLSVLFRRDAASFWPSFAEDPSGSPSSDGHGPQHHPFLSYLVDERPNPYAEAAPPPESVVVFEDKQAVHVVQKVRAPQPPRRTVSEKTSGGGGAAVGRKSAAMEAWPAELRRAKSDIGRRRQRRSAAAAAQAPAELATDDGEAFRKMVEAFIAKQQTSFREESLIAARAAAAAAGARGGGEDGPAIAGAAAVAVK